MLSKIVAVQTYTPNLVTVEDYDKLMRGEVQIDILEQYEDCTADQLIVMIKELKELIDHHNSNKITQYTELKKTMSVITHPDAFISFHGHYDIPTFSIFNDSKIISQNIIHKGGIGFFIDETVANYGDIMDYIIRRLE